jgi:hypothetical protein
MAFGQNSVGEQPRAHFQTAGGTIMKFRHPFLAGQLSGTLGNLDEIDISSSVKLDSEFFKATPNQDSAKQEVLVDGTTVTITNTMLNGTITLQLIRTSGIVARGDAIACFQLIKATGDNVGGTLTVTEFIDGKAITTLYYGVAVKNVDDKILQGLSVPVYPAQLLYAGWIQVVSNSAQLNTKAIWAAGSLNGVTGIYTMFPVNEGASGDSPLDTTIAGGGSNQIPSAADASAGAEDNSANAASAATELGGTVLTP